MCAQLGEELERTSSEHEIPPCCKCAFNEKSRGREVLITRGPNKTGRDQIMGIAHHMLPS